MALLRLLPLFALVSAAVSMAGESETFRSELFFVPAPIHVRYEFDAATEAGAGELKSVPGVWARTGRVRIAPEFQGQLRHLGNGTHYDMRGIMREWGLALPEGSFAVLAPEARILFVRSTPADLKLADACLETTVRLPQAISFDVQITAKSVKNGEQKLFSGKAIGTQSGQKTVLTSTGGAGETATKVEIAVEPVNDGSGTSVRVDLEGSISQGSSQCRIATLLAAEFGQEAIAKLSLNKDTEIALKFTFGQKLLGLPAELESADAKKKIISEVESDLLSITKNRR